MPGTIWNSWSFDPLVLGGVVVGSLVYVRGLRTLWQRAGAGRGVQRRQAVAFGGGLFVILVALVTPLDALSSALFAAHMVQHLLLILVAAPLLALGAPGTVYLWALSPPRRRDAGRWWRRARLLRAAWRQLSRPPVVWALAAVALWIWHAPALYEAALRSEPLHALEHACFLVTSALFWWTLVRREGRGRVGHGAAALYVVAMALQSTLLGALLTFSGTPWYAAYAGTVAVWGLSPATDQQLAGLIMWVPAGAFYLIAAGAFFVAWLAQAERDEEARTPLRPTVETSEG